jgi:hypothetical protein
MIECDGNARGFFLEYDRGTESRRDYRRKLAAYHEYAASGRFRRDYEGFPDVLVVSVSNRAEQRIAEAARAVAVGRDQRLSVLLTTEWRLRRDPRNPDGWFGSIWRKAEFGPDVRQCWAPEFRRQSAEACGSTDRALVGQHLMLDRVGRAP